MGNDRVGRFAIPAIFKSGHIPQAIIQRVEVDAVVVREVELPPDRGEHGTIVRCGLSVIPDYLVAKFTKVVQRCFEEFLAPESGSQTLDRISSQSDWSDVTFRDRTRRSDPRDIGRTESEPTGSQVSCRAGNDREDTKRKGDGQSTRLTTHRRA